MQTFLMVWRGFLGHEKAEVVEATKARVRAVIDELDHHGSLMRALWV